MVVVLPEFLNRLILVIVHDNGTDVPGIHIDFPFEEEWVPGPQDFDFPVGEGCLH